MKRPAFIVAAATGCAFLGLVALMRFDPDDYNLLDTTATSLVHPFQTLPWVEFFLSVTTLGGVTGVLAISLMVAFLLRKEPALIARLAIALIGESVTVQVVKALIARVRPDALPWIGPLHSFSFPSGHSGAAMALFGFIAYVAIRRAKSVPVEALAFSIPALLILAIGASRIVLAAHYASDVLAGYLVGAFWLSLALLVPLPKRLGTIRV